jgi:hypothetical protein
VPGQAICPDYTIVPLHYGARAGNLQHAADCLPVLGLMPVLRVLGRAAPVPVPIAGSCWVTTGHYWSVLGLILSHLLSPMLALRGPPSSSLARAVHGGPHEPQRRCCTRRRSRGGAASGEQLAAAVGAAAAGLGRPGAGVAPSGAGGDVRGPAGGTPGPRGGRCAATGPSPALAARYEALTAGGPHWGSLGHPARAVGEAMRLPVRPAAAGGAVEVARVVRARHSWTAPRRPGGVALEWTPDWTLDWTASSPPVVSASGVSASRVR